MGKTGIDKQPFTLKLNQSIFKNPDRYKHRNIDTERVWLQ